jgi:hypothetical protein
MTMEVASVTVSLAASDNELIKMCELATVSPYGFKYNVTVCAEAEVLHKIISLITTVVLCPTLKEAVYRSAADVVNAAGPLSLVGSNGIRLPPLRFSYYLP